MSDPVNPSHYKDGDVECIDAIESSMNREGFKGYLKGNIMKYLWRYENKMYNGILKPMENLNKAQWYMDKLKMTVSKERNL
tara:strand:- start:1162 stop:1404 length:243 start_codon:yes stop_codon:yes gene_type:complete